MQDKALVVSARLKASESVVSASGMVSSYGTYELSPIK